MDNEEKTLVVIDDFSFEDIDKVQRKSLDRLVGFVSTHCNVSVAICNQDFFSTPAIARKCANIWVIWKPSCEQELNTIARRCGIAAKDIAHIFNTICTEYHDSLTVDHTVPPQFKLRKNGFEIITKNNKNNKK